jgi:hypothetical protein
MQLPRNISNTRIGRLAHHAHAVRVPDLPTCNSHSPTASAANASGFLLTALSNARTDTLVQTHSSALRASDKALTSTGQRGECIHCIRSLRASLTSELARKAPRTLTNLTVRLGIPEPKPFSGVSHQSRTAKLFGQMAHAEDLDLCPSFVPITISPLTCACPL